jgi:hypothetical protein
MWLRNVVNEETLTHYLHVASILMASALTAIRGSVLGVAIGYGRNVTRIRDYFPSWKMINSSFSLSYDCLCVPPSLIPIRGKAAGTYTRILSCIYCLLLTLVKVSVPTLTPLRINGVSIT